MAETCTCEPKPTLIFPCSGGSNVGQLTNQVAVDLTRAGVGKLYCLAGIAAHIERFLESAGKAGRVVAIDGCEQRCAAMTLRHGGINVTNEVVITNLGVKKNHQFDLVPDELKLTYDHLFNQLNTGMQSL